MIANEEEDDCADAVVALKDATRSREMTFTQDFASTDMYENVVVSIEKAMNIDPTSDAMIKNCQVSYKLLVNDGNDNWVEWSALRQTMQESATFPLTSYLEFDRASAYLHVDFSNRDYEFFKDTVFASGAMSFKVKAIVAGSAVQGPANDDDQVAAEFAIKFIDAEAVDQCKDN